MHPPPQIRSWLQAKEIWSLLLGPPTLEMFPPSLSRIIQRACLNNFQSRLKIFRTLLYKPNFPTSFPWFTFLRAATYMCFKVHGCFFFVFTLYPVETYFLSQQICIFYWQPCQRHGLAVPRAGDRSYVAGSIRGWSRSHLTYITGGW